MNSAVFIRRKSVLALWILTPLVVMAGMLVFSNGLLERQIEGLHQTQALALLIPEMKTALEDYNRFAADYQLASRNLSMQDYYIALFNSAAEKAKFVVSAINLTPDNTKDNPSDVMRIVLLVKGSGTTAETAAFLNHVKELDPLIYENQIQIFPDRSHSGSMLLEAEFGRVYLNTESKNEAVIQN